jgi:hypothetical protein
MKRILRFSDNQQGTHCEEAYKAGKRVSVTGTDDVDGQVKTYTGHVLSVGYASGHGWNVTIELPE